jgi:diketogulonate reductase-like aldo/keto reductase
VNQIEFHPHVLPLLTSVVELCHARQIALACYTPLASITKRKGTKLDAVVEQIANERGETAAQVLLAWARAESGGYVITYVKVTFNG